MGAGDAGSVTIPRGQLKNLKASFTLNEPQLTAPLKKGQVVGTIDFQLNGKSIEQRPLMVMENVEEGGFFQPDVGFCADETPSVVWQLVLVK
ncbi:D-alanyl-D-alanine carboxypeptidase fraction C [Salmonella enterica subsp. enterica]|uniref:D-alanyl-D-alanine carboxypeptidase fraction C n=1 Tax=Salmonella enterica I TaxID=59201 RepID=A0A447U6J3_SALET|nr:D-alanyl-D-alanine carboxypeptidase fraction C [Salmonella enterica subsp. enterica]